METKEMLDQLAELRTGLDLLAMPFQEKIALLNAEMTEAIADVAQDIQFLEAEIKDTVLDDGATVKGARLQAVFTGGRVSWDTRALDGYAKANPDVLAFRKTGKPSVSIRVVK